MVLELDDFVGKSNAQSQHPQDCDNINIDDFPCNSDSLVDKFWGNFSTNNSETVDNCCDVNEHFDKFDVGVDNSTDRDQENCKGDNFDSSECLPVECDHNQVCVCLCCCNLTVCDNELVAPPHRHTP